MTKPKQRGGRRPGAGRPLRGSAPTRTCSISLTPEAWEAIDELAASAGTSRSQAVERAVAAHCDLGQIGRESPPGSHAASLYLRPAADSRLGEMAREQGVSRAAVVERLLGIDPSTGGARETVAEDHDPGPGAHRRAVALGHLLSALRLLVSRPHRVEDLGAEIGIHRRQAYRLMRVLRQSGLGLDRWREGSTVYYQLPLDRLVAYLRSL